jgi:hypothetical protein
VIIYLSAIESSKEHLATVLKQQPPHVLTSFLYSGWQNIGIRVPMWEQALRNSKVRLMDSGAFSFRMAVEGQSGGGALSTDFDEFAHAYIKWLYSMKRRRLADWWVELDIGALVGQSWVNATRRKFIGAGLGGGLIQVWHSREHDWDYWLYLLRESRRPGRSGYVGIEGHNLGRERLDYGKFLREAYKRGVRVHGFRLTKAGDMQRWPFYSVDSTSWIVTMHAGGVPGIHIGGGATQMRNQDQGGAMSGRRALWYGPFPRKQPRGWRMNILDVSCASWMREEQKLNDLWKMRGIDWEAAIANPEIVDDDGSTHPLARL